MKSVYSEPKSIEIIPIPLIPNKRPSANISPLRKELSKSENIILIPLPNIKPKHKANSFSNKRELLGVIDKNKLQPIKGPERIKSKLLKINSEEKVEMNSLALPPDKGKNPAIKRQSSSTIVSKREFYRSLSDLTNPSGKIYHLKTQIEINDHTTLQLTFDYEVNKDTPSKIVEEMIRDVSIDSDDAPLIENAIIQELYRLQNCNEKTKKNDVVIEQSQIDSIIEDIKEIGISEEECEIIENTSTIEEANKAFALEALKLCQEYLTQKSKIENKIKK